MNKELLLKLLEERKLKELYEILLKANPVDLAEILFELDEKDMV